MKRKICAFVILLFVLLTAACGNSGAINANSELLNAKEGIIAAVRVLEDSVNHKDKKGFLMLVDEKNTEFYTEESHWFDDLLQNQIKNFNMKVTGVKGLDDETFKVSISQGYIYDKRIEFSYDCIFKKYNKNYKFNDLYFLELNTGNFIIKYAPSLKDEALKLSEFVDDTYSNVRNIYGYAPDEKTIIKLYDDIDVLKYFIKPTLSINLGGWFEGGESIKINMTHGSLNSVGGERFKDAYTGMISHELTHKINFIESKNNAPYWLMEGIATYVQYNGSLGDLKPSLSLPELEKQDLEKLSGQEEIMNYYRNAYIYVSHFIDKYGKDKLHKILLELGKYPEKDKTAELLIEENNRTLHEVLQKTMSISMDDLNALGKQ